MIDKTLAYFIYGAVLLFVMASPFIFLLDPQSMSEEELDSLLK